MKQHFSPLAKRLLIIIVAITALSLTISIAVSGINLISVKRSEAWNYLESSANLLSATLAAPLDFQDWDTAKEDISSLAFQPNMEFAVIHAANDAQAIQWGPVPHDFIVSQACAQEKQYTFERLTLCKTIRSEGRSVGNLVLSYQLNAMWASAKEYLLFSLLAAATGLLISFLTALRLRNHMLKPLLTLTQATKDIAIQKDYSLRVPPGPQDEVGELITQFNDMLDEIEKRDQWLTAHRETLEKMVERRTAELQDKTVRLSQEVKERQRAEMIREEVERINRHDLKSVLNLVIGYPELLFREGGLTSKQTEYIKRIEVAGFRMLDMIKGHLDIFKMEKGIYTLSPNNVDLIEMLCQLEEELAQPLTASNVSLEIILDDQPVTGEETVFLNGEYRLLQNMFNNLLVNAIHASRQHGKIAINLSTSANTISIHNEIPVPHEIRERFFSKYVTHGKEDGTGLGTYSALLIAKAHGAKLKLKTGDSFGTQITVCVTNLTPLTT